MSFSRLARWRTWLLAGLLLALTLFEYGHTFAPSSLAVSPRNKIFSSSSIWNAAGSSDDERRWSKPQQDERELEETAALGSAKIAALSVSERTKRAMLAEAVEDRLFSLKESLRLKLLEKQKFLDKGIAPDSTSQAQQLEERINELAREIRVAQAQYRELVTGEASEMLNQLELLGRWLRIDEEDSLPDGGKGEMQ